MYRLGPNAFLTSGDLAASSRKEKLKAAAYLGAAALSAVIAGETSGAAEMASGVVGLGTGIIGLSHVSHAIYFDGEKREAVREERQMAQAVDQLIVSAQQPV